MHTQQFRPTRWTLLFLLLSAMMILMGGAAVAPALPLISQAFPDASETTIALIITLPALAIAITGFFVGALSDRVGKIPVLAASVAIFTIAGSSGFYLADIWTLLIGRFILGVGIAGITCTTSALVICYYDGIDRARVLGYQAAAMGIGVLILETSGGFLAGISWRAAFLIYLIGIVILAGVLMTMREPHRIAFSDTAADPGEKFPAAGLVPVYITVFCGNLLFFLMPTRLPYLLASMDAARIAMENTALLSGIFLGVAGCASTIIGLFYSRIAWRFHRNVLLFLTFFFFGTGLCGFAFATTLPPIGFSVICIGIAEGILMPTVLTWIAAITPRQFLGRAGGGFSVALNTGQFASALAIVPVLAIAASYGNMFLAFGCLAFLLALPYLAAILRGKIRPDQTGEFCGAGAR